MSQNLIFKTKIHTHLRELLTRVWKLSIHDVSKGVLQSKPRSTMRDESQQKINPHIPERSEWFRWCRFCRRSAPTRACRCTCVLKQDEQAGQCCTRDEKRARAKDTYLRRWPAWRWRRELAAPRPVRERGPLPACPGSRDAVAGRWWNTRPSCTETRANVIAADWSRLRSSRFFSRRPLHSARSSRVYNVIDDDGCSTVLPHLQKSHSLTENTIINII